MSSKIYRSDKPNVFFIPLCLHKEMKTFGVAVCSDTFLPTHSLQRNIPSRVLLYESSSQKPENGIFPAWAICQPSDITHVTLNKCLAFLGSPQPRY